MDADRSAMLTGAPRLPPGVIERPRLLDALDGPHPLVVIRSPGGTGKTTLLAQWSARRANDRDHERAIVWLSPDDATHSRSGYWMRLLAQLRIAGLISAETEEREVASLASDGSAVDALRRALAGSTRPVTVVLDNVGAVEPHTFWDDVCQDIVEAVRVIARLRCVVAGRFATALESPGLRSTIDVRVIDGDEMLLTPAETRAIVDAHGDGLDAEGRQRVCELDSSSQPMALRYTLEMLRQSPQHARELGRPGATLPHLDIARQDVLGRVRDKGALDFMGATALSPMVDVPLAERLTGRADARAVLDLLEASGAGQWSRDRDGAAVFRYSEYLRAVASAEYASRHPGHVARLHALIARWLFEERDEKLGALEHAVAAHDLEFASHVLLRTYPMSDEDREHVGLLLNDLPAHQIHRHPLLALRYALILNAKESTQARALEYFISSSAVGRLRAGSTPEGERAIRVGIESAVWRLLGQDKRMGKRADEAVSLMEHALRAPDRDESLEWASLQALHHAGISLMYAGHYGRARDAFSLVAEVAARRGRAGFENAAWCGLAMIAVLRGEYGSAAEHLDRIEVDAWPAPWATGYMASLGFIAQAWVHLNDGRPAQALATLDVLDPHAATIEHWDLMLSARVLAETMSGRGHEAQLMFDSVTATRVTKRTFDSTHDRLSLIDAMLSIAADTPRPLDAAVLKRSLAPLGHALEAIVSERHGETEAMHAHLIAAESGAADALARAFAAVAGAVAASRPTSSLTVERYAGRLRALATEHDLRWPLVLLPESARAVCVRSASATDRRDGSLERAFAIIPALVPSAGAVSVSTPRLTRREREILNAMVFIESRADLATHLFVSVNTVKTQMRSLYAKLDVSTREEALEKALAYGLIERSDGRKAQE